MNYMKRMLIEGDILVQRGFYTANGPSWNAGGRFWAV